MPSFENSRTITIAAPPKVVHALVEDFHEWTKWSPWEGVDVDLARTYSGAERGVGARYGWVGKKTGQGTMAIIAASSDRIEIALEFLKPMRAKNKAVFRFDVDGGSTRVTWTMSGTRNVLLAVLGKLFFDSMIGKDFEKGLAKLKAAAEG